MIQVHSVNSLVTDQLGHTKSEMTRRYFKRAPQVLADALEARRGNVSKTETANSKTKIRDYPYLIFNSQTFYITKCHPKKYHFIQII